MRRKLGALSVGVLAIAVAASGCSKTTDNGGSTNSGNKQEGTVSYAPADNKGPAAAVAGASKGGVVTILQNADFDHLDPAKNYVSTQQLIGMQIYRPLTGWKEAGSGKIKIVGDLAEDPGTDVNKDCKSWKYTIRKGVKYEDGSEVKAKDVAYGVARSFSPDWSDGPHYIQQWLVGNQEYNTTYKGPFDGGAAMPPGVTVDGDYSITFNLKEAHCDFPMAAALTTTAPVPQAKDTKGDYDLTPFSSGPYRVKEHKNGQTLVLERNPNWDANTDPLRNAYPDGYKFEFNLEGAAIVQRLLADNGDDKSTFSWADCTAELAAKCTDPAIKARTVAGATQYTWVLNINMQRITDLNVRKALNIALDKKGILQTLGGDLAGELATTLSSPTTAGFQKYDAFSAPASGDAEKAKALLNGAKPKIVYAVRQTATYQKVAAVVKESLEKAGFEVVLTPIDRQKYYSTLGDKANPYDIYLTGWGSDWPSGATIIPPLYDGRAIAPTGNQDYSYMNDAATNAEIDRIGKLPAGDQAVEWMKLDKKIMTDVVPVVPVWYDRTFELVGSKIGGATLSDSYGAISLNGLFVKQ